MSRAFVKERDDDDGGVTLADRPISPHRNLVTHRGLRLIEAHVDDCRGRLGAAEAAGDAEELRRMARELRYWTARRATAECLEPDGADRVVFGAAVTGRREDGRRLTLRIVGEDEAEPAAGRIAWTAPVAQALLGAETGDTAELPSGELEILSIDVTPEASG
jgi:transcription elongation GreA/GreB family factor